MLTGVPCFATKSRWNLEMETARDHLPQTGPFPFQHGPAKASGFQERCAADSQKDQRWFFWRRFHTLHPYLNSGKEDPGPVIHRHPDPKSDWNRQEKGQLPMTFRRQSIEPLMPGNQNEPMYGWDRLPIQESPTNISASVIAAMTTRFLPWMGTSKPDRQSLAVWGSRVPSYLLIGLCSLLLLNPLRADVLLYDDTLGNLPAAQPWLFYADDGIFSGGSASQSAIASGVNLNTDLAVSGGYSNYVPIVNSFKNPAFPILDRGQGFRLTFELELLSETHVSDDRAGFSVILLADDMLGIELGFWEDRIWAQNDNPLFTQGEGVAFDTTQGEVIFELLILGDQYFLSADGNMILSDSLRDYTAFGGPPYTLGSYLFLGDNTGSGGANVNLGRISIANIPEPSGLSLIACLVLVGITRRRTR